MARTKQTSRRSTGGATLLYRKGRDSAKKDLLQSKPPTSDSKSKRSSGSRRPKLAATSYSTSSITIAESGRSKRPSLSLASPSSTRVDSDPSISSLSEALSRLGSSGGNRSDTSSSPSSFTPGRSFFSNSTRILAIIKDVCEAFDGVPYVKSVAGLVQHIIEVIEEVQAYKERCKALVNKVALFSHGVFEGLLALTRTTHSGEQIRSLESDLLAFLRVLECIYTVLNSLTTSRVSSRFLRYVARTETLQCIEEQEKNLDTYIQYFNTRSNIALRLGLFTGTEQHVSSKPRPKMKRIPSAQAIYGREDEVDTIVELLSGAEPSKQVNLCILGPGGIGKTALAVFVLGNERVIKRFGDGRIFLSCDGAPSLDLLIHELGSALEVATDELSSQLIQSISLRLRQRQYLIVLDNLETVWDPLRTRSEVEAFLLDISSISTVNLLVTLRGSQHPAGVEWSQLLPPLQPLDLESAKTVFEKISRKMDSYAIELIRAIDCVLLAVTLLAHLAAVHGVTTESLWERWTDEKTTMIERGEDRLENLDSSIQLSLSSPRINHDPNALPFLSIIALLPNGMSHDIFRACDTHLPEIINVKRAVNTLRQNALIYEDSARTLRVLSPIRHYVLSHYPPSETASEYVENYFLQLAFLGGEHVAAVHSRLKIEIGNVEEMLVRALRTTRPVEDAISAILALAEYTHVSGVGSCIPLACAVERLEELAQVTPKPQKSVGKKLRRFLLGRTGKNGGADHAEHDLQTLQADCLGCWGQLLTRQGRYEQAKEKFELALGFHTQRGDLAGQAADLHNLGCLLTLDDALAKFKAASALHEKVGDRTGIAHDMMGSGQVYLQRCRLPQAKEMFSIALRMFEEAEEDVIGRIAALNNIGYTLTTWNKFSEGEVYFNQALQANEAIGDVVCKADSFCGLASVHLLCSRFGKAEECIQEAIALRRPYEDPDHYHVLGRVKCAQWKLTEAAEIFRYTRMLRRDPKDDSGRGDDLKYLGYTLYLLGRVDEAQQILEDVEILYGNADNPIGLAELRIGQAEIWTQRGRLSGAEAVAQEAVGVMEVLDCGLGRAHGLFVLGGIKLASRRYGEARESIELALGLHRDVGSVQGQADDLGRLAEIMVEESRPGDESTQLDEALAKVNEALALHEEIGDTAGMGDDSYLQAVILMKRGNPREAEQAVQHALQQHIAAEVTFKQGKDYALLGRVLEIEGEMEESLAALELAFSVFEKVGAAKELESSRDIRARLAG